LRNTAIGAAILALAAGFALQAQAAYTVTLEQQGPDVVATGSGSIDLTDISFFAVGNAQAGVFPLAGRILTGPTSATADLYTGFSGPASFGGGGPTFANSGSGDTASILVASGFISVPAGYAAGNPLSDTSTYDNTTLADLGATPGTYVWIWGTGVHADSFTLQIVPAAVPEPASLTVLALGLTRAWHGATHARLS
jgi:hypothetical protein